jgi:hypothetical protein
MIYGYSKLDDAAVKTVQDLEKKMGVTIVAFTGQDVKTTDLSEADMKQVQETEAKLGVTLVAVTA